MLDQLDKTQKLVITFIFAINFGGGVAVFDSWTWRIGYFVFCVIAAVCMGMLYVALGRRAKQTATPEKT